MVLAALRSIVTAVSLLAIFRQLRLQRSAGAIEQIDAFMREFLIRVEQELRTGIIASPEAPTRAPPACLRPMLLPRRPLPRVESGVDSVDSCLD